MKSSGRFAKPSDQGGFTLVELMVALLISAFLIGGILLMAFSGRAASIESEHLSRVQENVRFTSDFLVRELRNAGFRDEISLRIDMFNAFADSPPPPPPGAEQWPAGFAIVRDSGREILIRMSGARTCGNESRPSVVGSLVTNRYFIETETERCPQGCLLCQGEVWIPDPPEDEEPVERFNAVTLAAGLRDIEFVIECPDGTGTDCNCSLWDFGNSDMEEEVLRNTCDAVRINLTFDGPGGGDGTNPVEVELRAAFRNIVLGRLQWAGIPPPLSP